MEQNNTPKGRGGRKTKRDRLALQESSDTYNPDIKKLFLGNPNGKVIIMNRLSLKTAASEGDKAQREANVEAAIADGWDVTKFEEIWETGSAWKAGKWRPIIDALIKRIKNGEIAAIYCYEVSRLTRDPRVGKIIQQVVQTYNVPVRFVKSPMLHPEKTDAVNEILYVVMIQMAQSASEDTSHRTKRNHIYRAKLGRKRGGSEPMGLKTIKVLPEAGGFVEVDKETLGAWSIYEPNFAIREDYPVGIGSEAKLVQMMYLWIIAGIGYTRIAKKLTELNVPTFGAEVWNRTTVKRILTNPVYAGYSKYYGEIVKDDSGNDVAIHRPLIDKDTWEKVQKLINESSWKEKKEFRNYKLSGSLYCTICNRKMNGKAMTKRHSENIKNSRRINPPVYTCSGYADGVCKSNTIIMEKVDETFRDLIIALISKKDNFKKYLVRNEVIESAVEKELEDLQLKLNNFKAKLDKATDDDDIEVYSDKVQSLEDKVSKLVARKEIIIEKDVAVDFTPEDIKAIWESGDNIRVQQIVKAVFAGIYINKIPAEAQPLNQFQLAKLGWKTDMRRIEVEFHNGVRLNLANASDKLLESLEDKTLV